MSRRFEPGAELILRLSAKPNATLVLPVLVVYTTPEKNGLWSIGCEFIYPPSQEELQICLQERSLPRTR